MELAEGWIDMERGARTSGSRFAYLLGDVARLWLAIQRLALDHVAEQGFTLVLPPVLVREETMYGTGFFPTDRQSVYTLADDDLFLVGTSEVPIAAFHQKEIIDEAELPLRYAGLSACFRREAGAAGRDTRGIFRTHQFEKVEMFSFCHPDRSWDEHAWMLSIEETIAQTLGLHYRVVNIAAGDLGASAAKKYDIEVWLPGQGRYRELTSCSNCTDYQARRLEARYRPDGGSPRVRAHAQRHRRDVVALGHRRARDAPAGGRQRRRARGAAAPRARPRGSPRAAAEPARRARAAPRATGAGGGRPAAAGGAARPGAGAGRARPAAWARARSAVPTCSWPRATCRCTARRSCPGTRRSAS